jgi:hypothetical protein
MAMRQVPNRVVFHRKRRRLSKGGLPSIVGPHLHNYLVLSGDSTGSLRISQSKRRWIRKSSSQAICSGCRIVSTAFAEGLEGPGKRESGAGGSDFIQMQLVMMVRIFQITGSLTSQSSSLCILNLQFGFKHMAKSSPGDRCKKTINILINGGVSSMDLC